MGFTDSLLPLVLVKKLNKPLCCVFTPGWIYRMGRGEWKRDLEVSPSEHPAATSAVPVYTISAAGSGHRVLLKGKKTSLSFEILSEYKVFKCEKGFFLLLRLS